ncbi:MAG: RNA polymerase sigma factor [Clostridia bacterium]|nr:RNA polymerase sigma factor [Clostridia bacterium]
MDTLRKQWLEDAMARWETSLVRLCYAYLGDRALAEDAVQETFLKAWKGYGQFHGEAQEKTWLMRIAINTCKDVRRSAWFRHTDRSVPLEDLPEPSAPFTFRDDTVTRAVMGLKPKLKAVVLLRWYQQLTAEETAQALGISRSAVFKRLDKAREALRGELEEWYHEA